MRLLNSKKKGNVSLSLVLVFTAVLITMGINLILTSIDFSFNSKAYIGNSTARTLSRTCIEEAASKVKSNSSYTGTFSLTLANGSCSATITNSGVAGVKSIASSSTYDVYTFSETKKLDTNTSPFTISN